MKFKTVFPTIIYQAHLLGLKKPGSPRRSLLTELEREAFIIQKIDTDGLKWSEKNYPRGFTSYGSMDKLHETSPTFRDLEKRIDRHVKSFATRQQWDLRGGGLAMSSCWVNIMPAGATHSLHLHPLSVVSGTVYVNVPKGSSPIKFEDPRLERFMTQPPRKATAPSNVQPFVTLEPKAGEIILFESWLRHEVPPVSDRVRGHRLSISFNYDWV